MLVSSMVGRVGAPLTSARTEKPSTSRVADTAIRAHLVTRKPDLRDALTSYEAERKPRTSRVQAGARNNATLFHRGDPFTQLATYGPIWLAGQFLPTVAHGQYDWIYKHDVTDTPVTSS